MKRGPESTDGICQSKYRNCEVPSVRTVLSRRGQCWELAALKLYQRARCLSLSCWDHKLGDLTSDLLLTFAEVRKSMVEGLSDLVSSEGPLPGWQSAVCWCLSWQRTERGSKLSPVSL